MEEQQAIQQQDEGEMPDFSQFMAQEDEELAEMNEEHVAQVELAKAVSSMLSFNSEEFVYLPENVERRLLFQGGFVKVAKIGSSDIVDTPPQTQGSASPKDKNIFSSTKSFLKRKSLVVSKAISNELLSQGSVKKRATIPVYERAEEYLTVCASGSESDDMTQAFLFHDYLVLAKPLKSQNDLVALSCIELLNLSVRNIGTGFYTFEDDLGDLDENTNETSEEATAELDTSKLESLLEICETTSRERWIVDAGGKAHKEVWISQIVDAVTGQVQSERPMRASCKGWKHEIVRGTIWSAAREGDVFQMGQILRWIGATENENRGYLDATDELGMSAVHYAAWKGKTLILQQLLNSGAQPSSLDNDLMVPLHYAAMGLHFETARVLLEADCDVDAKDLKDQTPLILVCIYGLSRLATSSDDSERALISRRIVEFMDLLTNYDANLECKDVSGETALSTCLNNDETGVLMVHLLKAGAGIESRSSANGCTPLLSLCCQEVPSACLVSKLLSWGANPNARVESTQDTSLHILLGAKDFHAEDSSGVGKLRLISDEQRDVVSILISYGARLDLTNAKGVSCESLLGLQGIDVSEAAERWANRDEPLIVGKLVQSTYSYRVPYATAPGLSNWVDDSAVTACTSCSQPFSLMVRRKHCRRCGNIFDHSCCSKTFTLRPPPSKEAGQDQSNSGSKVRVCTPCFNTLVRAMTVAGKDVPADVLENEANARAELFGNRADAPKQTTTGASAASSTISAIGQTLQQAQESLAERGEKLSRLAEKSQQMNSNASNFSTMAKTLREREEKKAGWFGFF